MRKITLTLLLLFLVTLQAKAADEHKLWYDEPATDWETEALPIGNGHLGAMIYGGIGTEHIQYNEKTLWTGGPGQWNGYNGGNRADAYSHLINVQNHLDSGNTSSAHSELLSYCTGIEQGFGAYQTFGDIYIDFIGHTSSNTSNYRRELDLDAGLSKVTYTYGGHDYSRTYFSSYPDQVMVTKIANTGNQTMDMNIRVGTPHTGASMSFLGDTITTSGSLANNGMAYTSIVKIIQDGTLTMQHNRAEIRGATSIQFILAAGTDYASTYPTYKGDNPLSDVQATINTAQGYTYEQLLQRHQQDYKELYDRVDINLGEVGTDNTITTDHLKSKYNTSGSTYLEEVLFQYGRYLLIASSREGSLPANLQGIWNNSTNPPWYSDYHFNINLEMNYWPAEVTNLQECTRPLIDFVKALEEPGEKTAEIHYGTDTGWAVHTMVNPFGFTAPGWGLGWGWSPTSNAFICQNLWEHYLFNEDPTYLSDIYPTLKGASQFLLAILREDTDQTLVITPSYSPEQGGISKGCTYDQELVYELFANVIEASEILGIDATYRQQLITAKNKLSPIKVGKYGQIQEWKADIDNPSNNHRHISHLVALYPGKQINADNETLFNAAKVTLNHRGNEGTGWSKANKILLWARAKDGNRAHLIANGQIKNSTLKNLFDTHPPFQIDGNFGYTAGVAEMLLQSHMSYMEPLPALPDTWATGQIQGLVARGAFDVDMTWDSKKIQTMKVLSKKGNPCSIKNPYILQGGTYTITDEGSNAITSSLDHDKINFATTADMTYTITFQYPVESPMISKNTYTLVSVDSEETVGEDGVGINAFDDDTDTIWHTQWKDSSPTHPHEIILNLGQLYEVDKLTYLPRQNATDNGDILDYEIYLSQDNTSWTKVHEGTFANNKDMKTCSFNKTQGQYVKAIALSEVNNQPWTSIAELAIYGIGQQPTIQLLDHSNYTLLHVDSEETVGEDGVGTNAIDGNENTHWHTQWQATSPIHPHEIQIDLGTAYTIAQVRYLPRQTGNMNGTIAEYDLYITDDTSNWGDPAATGTWANNRDEKTIDVVKQGRYVKLVAKSEVNNNPWTTVAELQIYVNN